MYLKSSMDSNTTAFPLCCINRGVAAEGLSTAPLGAKLPLSTTIPPWSLKGALSGVITSLFQQSTPSRFSPTVLPVTALSDVSMLWRKWIWRKYLWGRRCGEGVPFLSSQRAHRLHSKSPPSDICLMELDWPNRAHPGRVGPNPLVLSWLL